MIFILPFGMLRQSLSLRQTVKQSQEIRLQQIQISQLNQSIKSTVDSIYPPEKNIAIIDQLIKKFTDNINNEGLKEIIKISL